jgi:hypothetical protein
VTKEQLIVVGFIAAAFLAGWLASIATRRRGPGVQEEPPPLPEHRLEPVTAAARADGAPLAEEVGDALRSDAANEGMLSVVRADREGLSEMELDLADWGFTYGVAWARARERTPAEADDAVAAEALEAAQRVFRAYTAGDDWTQRAGDEVRGTSNGAGQP